MQPAANADASPTQEAAPESVLGMRDVELTLDAASGPVEILRGISLSISPGEIVSIIGPSGSGKSSLISVAAGLERPTAGEVTLLGENLNNLNEDGLARLRRGRVTMVFQSFHLIPTMTAYDNVRAPLEIAEIDNVDERARKALEDVELSHRLHHFPGQLSGGEQQRVAVARALACGPELVFADEPTGNLDGRSGKHVADLLFGLAADRGATLVMVTHDLELAKRANRTIAIEDGRIA